jgi:hypothetical protein
LTEDTRGIGLLLGEEMEMDGSLREIINGTFRHFL